MEKTSHCVKGCEAFGIPRKLNRLVVALKRGLFLFQRSCVDLVVSWCTCRGARLRFGWEGWVLLLTEEASGCVKG